MNKEEFFISECRFFSRLDVRLIALSNLLNEHENVLLATVGSKKEELDKVRKFHKDIVSSLIKEDKETVDYYTKYFEKLEKEQNNDTN
jgi:hypothetical protein